MNGVSIPAGNHCDRAYRVVFRFPPVSPSVSLPEDGYIVQYHLNLVAADRLRFALTACRVTFTIDARNTETEGDAMITDDLRAHFHAVDTTAICDGDKTIRVMSSVVRLRSARARMIGPASRPAAGV